MKCMRLNLNKTKGIQGHVFYTNKLVYDERVEYFLITNLFDEPCTTIYKNFFLPVL